MPLGSKVCPVDRLLRIGYTSAVPKGVKPMAKEQMRYQDRIIRDPKIMVGKPVVKGTRIPVETVLRHLAENPDLDDLFAAFPRLTREDVQACLAYAHQLLERRSRRSIPQYDHDEHEKAV